MTIRDLTVRCLRLIGAALTGTVHDRLIKHEFRLNDLSAQLNDLSVANKSFVETDAALLQGTIHMIESFQKSQKIYYQQADHLSRLESLLRECREMLASQVCAETD